MRKKKAKKLLEEWLSYRLIHKIPKEDEIIVQRYCKKTNTVEEYTFLGLIKIIYNL